MALVIPPGFAGVGIEFKHNSDPQPWYITFGIDVSDAGGDWSAVTGAINIAVDNHLLPVISSDVTATGVRLTIGQDGDPLILYVPWTGMTGGGSPDVLPQNCAALVQKKTNLGGRKGKGRLYMPACLTETGVNQVGGINGTLLTALQGAFTGFYEEMASASGPEGALPMVLLHNDYGINTPDPTPITGLTVQNVIATQRRRLR